MLPLQSPPTEQVGPGVSRFTRTFTRYAPPHHSVPDLVPGRTRPEVSRLDG